MIIRERQRNFKEADSYSMFLSFTEADVKRALKAYKGILSKYLGNRATLNEKDITHYLSHTIFAFFPDKYTEELTHWAFKLAIRQSIIYPSGDVPNTYIFGDALNSDVL
jgi:hypothetical protein